MPEETSNNYGSLIAALRQRFASPNEQFLQRQELNDRKQGASESLSSYTEHIIRRCSRLGLNDINRMNCFISGLNDELKSHVILNRPTTFDEAESLARLKDALSKSTRCGKTDVHGPTRLISQIQDLLTDQKMTGKQVERPSSNIHQLERQRIAELEGQVQFLLSTINRPKESTVAPISTNYRTGNTATQDYDTMKKEIIAAVRDEIRRDTHQNAPPHRQDTGTGFTGNTQ